MSRCILDDEDRMIQVVIGRDPGMRSFFARVGDRDLFLEEKRAGKPESEAGVRLWTGGYDRIWTPADPLIELLQPYACRHDKRRLRVESGPATLELPTDPSGHSFNGSLTAGSCPIHLQPRLCGDFGARHPELSGARSVPCRRT